MVSGVEDEKAVLNWLPDTHPRLVNDPQLPEKSCICALVVPRLEPVELNKMVGYCEAAVNVYHTSPPSVLHAVGIDGALTVAPFNVPGTGAGTMAETRLVALAQASLLATSVTETEKFHAVPDGAAVFE